MNEKLSQCPICDLEMSETYDFYFGVRKCPSGHFRIEGQGNYASLGIITINGTEEEYHFDEGYGDELKFYEKIKELRNNMNS